MSHHPSDPFEAPDFDPEAFLARLVFADPGADVDLPVPPVLTEQDEIVVRHEFDPANYVRLRSVAAARGMSVQELVNDWAQHAA